MKVAVTGASGFIGTHLCRALTTAGHEVEAIRTDAARFQGQCLVHLAGIAHRRASAAELEEVNVRLTERLGRQAAASGARVVFVSSVKVHGEQSAAPFTERSPLDPEDAYGESKARAEDALRSIAGLSLTIVRPPLVYGPGVKANFLALMKALARRLPLPFAAVSNRRSLLYVGNLANAILTTLVKARASTYLVCDGAPVSTPDLCRAIGEALGRPARLFMFPPALIPFRSLTRSLEVNDAAIRTELGWRPPFSFEQGLRLTAEWYRGR